MNIIILMLDSLRADFLGCGGHPELRTPYIDKVSEEGLFFERAYAEYPITIPSRTAFLSGDYTFTNRPWCPLRNYDMHIAEVLRENGYTTAAFADSPFTGAGMDRGFDTFVRVLFGKCQPALTQKKYKFPQCYYAPDYSDEEEHFYPNTMVNRLYAQEKYGKSCPELLFDQVIEWLEENHQNNPFFLWIDSFEPHEPWCPPPPYNAMYSSSEHERYIPFPIGPDAGWMTEKDKKHVLALYMGDITHTDKQVGKITAKLKELNLEQNTMLVIVSDHGEPFGEHGTIRKYGVPIYEELSRMVFIIKKPGVVPSGKRSKALVGNIDLAPTILDLLGIEPPPRKEYIRFMGHGVSEKTDGVSLSPLFKDSNLSVREEIYLGAFGLRSGICQGWWKFIDNRGEKPNELFNLEEDPEERVNLAEDKKALARNLHHKLWEFQAKWSAILSWRDEPTRAPRRGTMLAKKTIIIK